MKALILAILLLPLHAAADTSRTRARLLEYALTQSEKPSVDWSHDQRDCAGLIRYVYRKAIGTPEPLWKDRAGNKKYFVNAEELVAGNFTRLPANETEEEYRSGDLLAYYSPEKKAGDRWHLMMLLKSPTHSARDVLVIYHNGATGSGALVKKLWLNELRSGPMAEWNPRAENPHFMGVYRWKGFM